MSTNTITQLATILNSINATEEQIINWHQKILKTNLIAILNSNEISEQQLLDWHQQLSQMQVNS